MSEQDEHQYRIGCGPQTGQPKALGFWARPDCKGHSRSSWVEKNGERRAWKKKRSVGEKGSLLPDCIRKSSNRKRCPFLPGVNDTARIDIIKQASEQLHMPTRSGMQHPMPAVKVYQIISYISNPCPASGDNSIQAYDWVDRTELRYARGYGPAGRPTQSTRLLGSADLQGLQPKLLG